MDEFRTIAKLWPSGAEVDLGTDSNLIGGPPATFTRNAAGFTTSPDGSQNYQFLFWNTGRRITTKRRVRWNFSVLNWGVWTATRWYGIPPESGGGPPRVHAEPFSIPGDSPLGGPTVIDAGASTFAAGAHPFNGSDREVGTSDGPASVAAKDPFNDKLFAGWLRLIWGGDPDGEFVETDTGTTGTFGDPSYYGHVIGGAFDAPQNTSADILATYGKPVDNGPVIDIRELLGEILRDRGPFEIPQRGDPSPLDFIRKGLLDKLIEMTRPGQATDGTDFNRLLAAAPRMDAEELKRAASSVKTTMSLGETVLAALEAQLKNLGR